MSGKSLVEPVFAAQDVVAQGEAGVERGGVDADVDAPVRWLRGRNRRLPLVCVELAALGRKAEVVDFEAGVGVARVDGVFGGLAAARRRRGAGREEKCFRKVTVDA
jgi:hypothetical protein